MRCARGLFVGALLMGAVATSAPSVGSAAGAGPFQAFRISESGRDGFSPRTDGRYVVWTDVYHPGGPTADNEVFGFDLATGRRLDVAVGPGWQAVGAVSNGTVLWDKWVPGQEGSGDVYGRALPSGPRFPVAAEPRVDATWAAIDGNVVVYQDGRAMPSIYARRLDQPAAPAFNVSGAQTTVAFAPDVSGDTVVWALGGEFNDYANIYGRRLSGGDIFTVSARRTGELYPRISGDVVVWEDWRNGNGAPSVWGKNLVTNQEFQIAESGSRPAIDGDLVVWMESHGTTWGIYGRRLSGGPQFVIDIEPDTSQMFPDVAGNLVVWQRGNSSDRRDIYGEYVPEPGGGAAAALCGVLALRRRRAA